MGRFDDYSGDKLAIEVEDEEYKLDMSAQDKGKLLTEQNKDDPDFGKLIALLQKVFVRSYPDESEGKIKNWVTQKAEQILLRLHVAWGNLSEDQVEEVKKGEMPEDLV